jgi:toxic protein SymE
MEQMKNVQAVAAVKTRKLKIGELYRRRADDIIMVPQIRLEGIWLEEFGFRMGDTVTIQMQQHQLIITADNPPKKMPGKKQPRWSNYGRCIL